MLIRNKNLTALLGGVAIAGSTYAAEVETTTKAPIQTIFPNAYSYTELSHHAKSLPKGEATRVDATYTLGSTFFDKMIDSYLIFGVKKYAGSSQFHQKSVDMETYVTAYNNDFVAIKPYILASFPYTDHKGVEHSTEGQMGVQVPLTYEVSTGVGAVTLGMYYDVSAKFNNRYKVKVTEDGKVLSTKDLDSDELALRGDQAKELGLAKVADGEFEVQPKSLALRQDAALTVRYRPNVISGLSLEWRTRHRIDSAPVMEYDRATNTIAPKEDNALAQVYSNSAATAHRLRTKYDINKVFYVQNDFNFQNKLVNEKLDYTNILILGANLF